MITPEPTIPSAAADTEVADSRPMLPATFSRGNSSRTMPNASGKIPPAAPWSARPTTSSASELATAASSVPTARITNVQTQHARLAVHVAEATEDRGADRGREQVGGQHPRRRPFRRYADRAGASAARGPRRAEHRVGERPNARTASVRLGSTLSDCCGHLVAGRRRQDRQEGQRRRRPRSPSPHPRG